MKASFTLFEMVLNNTASGKLMYIDEEDPNDPNSTISVQKIIDYVKVVPGTKDISIHFTDGVIAAATTYEPFDFEVNNKRVWKKANRKQIAASKENL